jgi:redox-sensitive bicupin YhaK (pirin superfamily)
MQSAGTAQSARVASHAHGAWHGGSCASGESLRVFQLWIALSPSEGSTPYASQGMKDGQRWRFVAPEGHNVTRLADGCGGLQLREGERVYWEQLGLFGGSDGVIEAQADRESSFVLGSGRRFPRTASGTVFRLPPCYPLLSRSG